MNPTCAETRTACVRSIAEGTGLPADAVTHLNACADCRVWRGIAERIWSAVGESGEIPPTGAIWERIRERAWRRRRVAGLAAAVLLGILAHAWNPVRQDPSEPSPAADLFPVRAYLEHEVDIVDYLRDHQGCCDCRGAKPEEGCAVFGAEP